MTTNKMLIAAGFVLAGITAAAAESGFEQRNDVPKGPTTGTQRILQLKVNPAGGAKRSALPSNSRRGQFDRTNNRGFSRGYSTFEVLDSIQ